MADLTDPSPGAAADSPDGAVDESVLRGTQLEWGHLEAGTYEPVGLESEFPPEDSEPAGFQPEGPEGPEGFETAGRQPEDIESVDVESDSGQCDSDQPGSDQPEAGDAEAFDWERGSTELIIGVLAGSALLPFVQAVATKAGEDVYHLVRDRLTRRARRRARDELREEGTVTLAEWDARILLQLPESLSPTMATRLATVQLPVDRTGWLLVRWDAARAHWQVEDCPSPPTTTTTLN